MKAHDAKIKAKDDKAGDPHYARLDAAFARIGMLETDLDAAVDALDRRMDGTSQTIASLTSRVNTLEEILATLASTVFELQQAHNKLCSHTNYGGCKVGGQ